MKNILPILFLAFTLVACKKEASVPQIAIKDSAIEVSSAKVIDTACSKKNSVADYVVALQILKSDVEKNLSSSSSENDKLYLNYYNKREKYILCLNSENKGVLKILNEFVNYYDEKSQSYKLPAAAKELESQLNKVDLEFWAIGEGYTEIRSKPKHYLSLFKGEVGDDVQAFIAQLAKENESLYSADAGIMISWKELGDRLIFWENFNTEYPKSIVYKKSESIYRDYLHDYIFGMDNTPTFEFSDSALYDENRTEFNRFLKKYPNSKSSEKIRELLKLLEAKTPSEEIFDKMIIDRI